MRKFFNVVLFLAGVAILGILAWLGYKVGVWIQTGL